MLKEEVMLQVHSNTHEPIAVELDLKSAVSIIMIYSYKMLDRCRRWKPNSGYSGIELLNKVCLWLGTK